MTRPTILDLDLVVVPREATDDWAVEYSKLTDRFPDGMNQSLERGSWVATVFLELAKREITASLSASPYPTAWDDVRKYVEGLEKECERLKFLVEWGEAFCDTKHPDTARAEAAEARIAELEKRLADAERVIEPFAECASEWDGEPDSLHVFLEWNDERKPVPSLPVADFRAARAYMEGK